MSIRLGVVGARRGRMFARIAPQVGMELTALCDTHEPLLREAEEEFGVTAYTDFDRFLEHDLDAVALCNYFHEHAPLAVKALKSGRHVISETSACKTLGEGVALARAVEETGKVYMFAENYAYFAYIQEMRRLCQAGEIGTVRYAEGEYNHPADRRTFEQLSPGLDHWRNHLPPTYYCTHAMAPIMHVTDSRPTSVCALSIPRSEGDGWSETTRVGDPGTVMICRMDNGSVARIMGLMLRGHSIWYRFHGTRGLMENLRTGNQGMVRVLHEDWDRREGEPAERVYQPDFPVHADLARRAGHGGGDFFVCYHFVEAIRTGKQPYLDVYRGIDMTLVGIQGWRSCLAEGAPVEIPDFRDESVRARYEDDDWSPFPEDRRPGQPYPSILGELTPKPEAVEFARQIWREMGMGH